MDKKGALKLLRGGPSGVAEWNRWRHVDDAPLWAIARGLKGEVLHGVDLHGAKLSGVELGCTGLAGADLSGADLSFARLYVANLQGANLRGADLHLADLHFSDLRDADLRDVWAPHADFSRANLQGANLSGARLSGVYLCELDLSEARGLEYVRHEGPSSLGIDTMLKSRGKIPDRFLRGCGVDPRLQRIILGDHAALVDAAYNTAKPIRFDSCFISYCTKDKPFVDRLQKVLNTQGVEYWYAPEHGRWGEKLTAQIDREIAVRDRVLLICSAASLNDSAWVQWEIERALAEGERRGRETIFPVTIDDAIFGWNHPRATRIRETLVGDFRKATKGKALQEKVSRLLEGLKTRALE